MRGKCLGILVLNEKCALPFPHSLSEGNVSKDFQKTAAGFKQRSIDQNQKANWKILRQKRFNGRRLIADESPLFSPSVIGDFNARKFYPAS